jgi:preprotein translocase subunit SecD
VARRRRAWAPLLVIVVLAAAFLSTVLVKGWSPRLGLDLQGGASVVYQAADESRVEDLDAALDTAMEIIRSRVDALGVAEPEIVRQGDSIVVNLPGIDDRDRALEVIGRTAELRFRPVLQTQPYLDAETLAGATSTTAPADGSSTTDTTAATETTPTTAAADPSTTPTSEGAFGLVEGENAGVVLPAQDPTSTSAPDTTATSTPGDTSTTSTPGDTSSTTAPPTGEEFSDPCFLLGGTTPEEGDLPEATVVLPGKEVEGQQRLCYQLGPVPTDGERSLVGSIVSGPEATIQNGEWGVNLNIRSGDLPLFNQTATACYAAAPDCPTRSLAIVLDELVQSAPGITQTPTFDETGLVISGSFSEREARDLALVLRFGALPIELEAQTVQEVSPTLGRDSLNAGLVAGFIGVGLVILYMLLYYRALGMVVLLGLAVWSAINFSIISWLGETQGLALSLAGVTGIVVSVGVTVDSYVVYFERLKDEIRSGKTIRSSVDRGFQRAFRTILTADVSSFIGAFLLYILTVGPVRGFAFFLGLATILDVVVAYFFTRPLVAVLGRSDFFTRSRMFGVARGAAPTEATA